MLNATRPAAELEKAVEEQKRIINKQHARIWKMAGPTDYSKNISAMGSGWYWVPGRSTGVGTSFGAPVGDHHCPISPMWMWLVTLGMMGGHSMKK